MNDQAILAMLKANLEKVNSVNDSYLVQLIGVAKTELAREGVVITATPVEDATTGETEDTYSLDDANLINMYAAYLYRNRVTNGEGYSTSALYPQGMPYMLRYAINNRIFEQKGVAQ